MASSSSNSGSKLLLMHPLPCPWFPFSTRPTLHTSFRRLPPCNHSRKGSDGSALFSRTGTPLSDLRCAARPEPNSTQPLLLFLSKIPMTTNSTSPKIPQPAFVRQTASHDVPAGSPTIRRLNHPSRSSLLRFELSFWDAPRQPCATWSCCSRYVVSSAGLVVQRWGLTPAGSHSDREKVDRAAVDPQKRGNI